MARRVKCQDTGEYSTSDVAYRATNGKYYSSEANYLQWKEQKEWREKSIALLFDLFEFDQNAVVPSILFKNLQKYESMGYDVVYDTIIDQQESIQWALKNKTFKSTSGVIMYVCKILENHMMDVYKIKQAKKKQEVQADRHFVEEIDNVLDVGQSGAGKDVSNLIGDDVWN